MPQKGTGYKPLSSTDYRVAVSSLDDQMQEGQDNTPTESWGHWFGHKAAPAAIRTIPAIGGAIAGSALGPGGTVGGGMLGGGGGELAAQALEKYLGDRKDYSPGQAAVSTAMGGIPVAEGAAGLGTLARMGLHGAQGAGMGAIGTTASSLMDKGELPELTDVGKNALVGGVMGAGMGMIPRGSRAPVEKGPGTDIGPLRNPNYKAPWDRPGSVRVEPTGPIPGPRASRIPEEPIGPVGDVVDQAPPPQLPPRGTPGLPQAPPGVPPSRMLPASRFGNMSAKDIQGLAMFGDKEAAQELINRGVTTPLGPSNIPPPKTPIRLKESYGGPQPQSDVIGGRTPIQPPGPRVPPPPVRPLGQAPPIAPIAPPEPQGLGPVGPPPGAPPMPPEPPPMPPATAPPTGMAKQQIQSQQTMKSAQALPPQPQPPVGGPAPMGQPPPTPPNIGPVGPPPGVKAPTMNLKAQLEASLEAQQGPKGRTPPPMTPAPPGSGAPPVIPPQSRVLPRPIEPSPPAMGPVGPVGEPPPMARPPAAAPPLRAAPTAGKIPSLQELDNSISVLTRETQNPKLPDEQFTTLNAQLAKLKRLRDVNYADELDARSMTAASPLGDVAPIGNAPPEAPPAAAPLGARARRRAVKEAGPRPPFAQRLRDERGMVDLTGQTGIPPQEPTGPVGEVPGAQPPPEQPGLGSKIKSKVQQAIDAYKNSRLGSEKGAVNLEGEGAGPASPSELKKKFARAKMEAGWVAEDTGKKIQGVGSWVGNRLGESRAYKAGLDLSGALRQGGQFKTRPFYYKTFGPAFQAMRSAEGDLKTQAGIANNPLYEAAKKAGVFFADDSHLEDKIVSKAAETGPITGTSDLAKNLAGKYQATIGKGYAASNRFHSAFLNQLRMNAFEDFAKKANPQDYESIANYINSSTGRGKLDFKNPLTGKQHNFEAAASTLNKTFFSARFAKSRVDLMNPKLYTWGNEAARREAWRDLAGNVAVMGSALALAKAAGAEVSMDPTNPDFGKVKIGNSRVDYSNGMQPYIRLLAQGLTMSKTSSVTGKSQELNTGKFGAPTMLDVIERFAEGKLAPLPGAVTDVLRGKKVTGDPLNFTTPNPFENEITGMFTPMVMDDIYHLARTDPKALPLMGPSAVLGDSVQTYSPQETTGGGTSRHPTHSISRRRR